MQIIVTNTSSLSPPGLNPTAREALEACLKSDSAHRKIVRQKLETAIGLLREALLCECGTLLSSRLPVDEDDARNALTNLEIVRAAARRFGNQPFSLTQLCGRVAETFPGFVLTRQTVARRLFDLRREQHPEIKIVSVNFIAGQPSKKGRRYVYSYVGPPC